MEADGRVADFPLDFGARDECGNGVDNDAVYCPRTNEHVANLERLLAGVGLRNEDFVNVYAEARRVYRIERMLGIDERNYTAERLRFCENLQGKRRFAAGLGTVYFDDATTGNASDAERGIKRKGPRGYGGNG